MKRDRGVLEKILTDTCSHVAVNKDVCNEVYNYMKGKYNIPKGLASDLVCLRVSMSETSEFILFCIADALINVLGGCLQITDFYTKQEIDKYSISVYKVDKIKFPLKFKMIQIKDDQWIGRIDHKVLMKLRAAQLINYNANAQRVLTKVVSGDKEIYKITLNQKAVKSINENLKNNSFVPNTLTLNIPQDEVSDYYYDSSSMELVIKNIQHFHIVDGFHRYIADCKASDENPNFDFTWELRVINFSDDKAKTFIYQEDKKTPMKRVDSNSYNMNDSANIVITRLNEDTRCNIKGLISRSGGSINFGELAELIKYFFYKEVSKKENNNLFVVFLVKYLGECFNALTEFDTKYFQKYSYKELFIVIYMFYIYRDRDKYEMCKVIDRMIKRQDDLDNKKFYSRIPRKAMVNEVEKLYEAVK